MTDRIHSLTVVLEKDYRDDDVKEIVNAIRMIRGVLSVKSHISDFQDHMAQERVRQELGEKLWEILYPKANTQ